MLLNLLLSEYRELTVNSLYTVTVYRKDSLDIFHFPKSREKLAWEVFYHYSNQIMNHGMIARVVISTIDGYIQS